MKQRHFMLIIAFISLIGVLFIEDLISRIGFLIIMIISWFSWFVEDVRLRIEDARKRKERELTTQEAYSGA